MRTIAKLLHRLLPVHCEFCQYPCGWRRVCQQCRAHYKEAKFYGTFSRCAPGIDTLGPTNPECDTYKS